MNVKYGRYQSKNTYRNSHYNIYLKFYLELDFKKSMQDNNQERQNN